MWTPEVYFCKLQQTCSNFAISTSRARVPLEFSASGNGVDPLVFSASGNRADPLVFSTLGNGVDPSRISALGAWVQFFCSRVVASAFQGLLQS